VRGRIERAFARLRDQGRAAFVPFVTYGDPEPTLTPQLLRALEEAGADLIELGVPFSDPMADGRILQRASERALAAGATLRGALDAIAEFRRRSDLPLVLFGYYNPFFRYGVDRIAADARMAGADGFLCVDLPPEESHDLERAARREGLHLIYLLAPTSTPERYRKVLARARGFVYFVSVTGVTGVRPTLPENLESLVARLRQETQLPIGVGFGISTPEQAARVARFADAVIVGSAIARAMEEAGSDGAVARVAEFASTLARAVHEARSTAPAAGIVGPV
jgi:tryptophan synthase alpha chain